MSTLRAYLKRNRLLAVIVLASLAVSGCSKKGTTRPAQTPGGTGNTGGASRATLIKNLTMDSVVGQTAAAAGVSQICAQLVKPNSGTNRDKHVVEISTGPCPTNGVADPNAGVVSVLTFGRIPNYNTYFYIFENGDTNYPYGEVYGANPGSNDSQLNIDRLRHLCDDASDEADGFDYSSDCSFRQSTDGKFQGIDFVS